MSDPASKGANGSPAILAVNLWIRFLIRYHREEMTLRRAFVRLFDRLRKNRADARKWREDYWALRGSNIVARPGESHHGKAKGLIATRRDTDISRRDIGTIEID